ncbi:MAG: BrnA antitoxin family protein [Burkholderiales bacterium]|nr:BrnA antitoxin family protein [Burkholderiales bacterium]
MFGEKVAKAMLKPRGRPRAEFPKERINIRLSHEVIEHFKSEGEGWQTRIDAALRQFIAERSSAN